VSTSILHRNLFSRLHCSLFLVQNLGSLLLVSTCCCRAQIRLIDATLYSSARSSILSVLEDLIVNGHLTIYDSGGTHYYGNYHRGCNDVHLQVNNDNFWLRILRWVSNQTVLVAVLSMDLPTVQETLAVSIRTTES